MEGGGQECKQLMMGYELCEIPMVAGSATESLSGVRGWLLGARQMRIFLTSYLMEILEYYQIYNTLIN